MVAGEIVVSKVGRHVLSKLLQSWSTVYLAGKWALVLNLVFGSGKELHPLEQNVCMGQGSVIQELIVTSLALFVRFLLPENLSARVYDPANACTDRQTHPLPSPIFP